MIFRRGTSVLHISCVDLNTIYIYARTIHNMTLEWDVNLI